MPFLNTDFPLHQPSGTVSSVVCLGASQHAVQAVRLLLDLLEEVWRPEDPHTARGRCKSWLCKSPSLQSHLTLSNVFHVSTEISHTTVLQCLDLTYEQENELFKHCFQELTSQNDMSQGELRSHGVPSSSSSRSQAPAVTWHARRSRACRRSPATRVEPSCWPRTARRSFCRPPSWPASLGGCVRTSCSLGVLHDGPTPPSMPTPSRLSVCTRTHIHNTLQFS